MLGGRERRKHARNDNGLKFIAAAIRHGERSGLEMLHVELESPWQDGFAESLLRRLRDELLNVEEVRGLRRDPLVRRAPLEEA